MNGASAGKSKSGTWKHGQISLNASVDYDPSGERKQSPRYESMYQAGTIGGVLSGQDNLYCVGKRPPPQSMIQYQTSNVDQILTEYNPDENKAENSRSSSQNSASIKKKRYPYTKPGPPYPDRDVIDVPGPNKYDVKNGTIEHRLKSMPRMTLKGREPLPSPEGSASRLPKYGQIKPPGPATYDPFSPIQSKKFVYTIPKSKRSKIDQFLLKMPGPTDYNPQRQEKVCMTAIIREPVGKETNDIKRDDSPGPGDYFTLMSNSSLPKYRFPKEDRFKSLNHSKISKDLSPVYYHPELDLIKQTIPRVKIGKEKRFNVDMNKNVPGVGFYPISLECLNKQTFSFGKQRRFLKKITNVALI